MVRKLLDLRAYLIVIGIIVGVCCVAIKELFGGSCVMLEMPHIEGGTEVTIQNMMNDIQKENGGQFVIPGFEKEDEPERNEWGVRKDLIKKGPSWLT